MASVGVESNQPGPEKQVEKIAILGGGLGSLTTAIHLTNDPDWKSKYDITVYQMGWRVGGKGASGRGPNNRIQEHGLHVWLGFYDNAFRMLEQAYDEVHRTGAGNVKKWEDAFEKHEFVVFGEKLPDRWALWRLDIPTKPDNPWEDVKVPTLWDSLQMAMTMLVDHFGKTMRIRREYEDKLCADMAFWPHVFFHLKLILEDFVLKMAFRTLEAAQKAVMDLDTSKDHRNPGFEERLLHDLAKSFRFIKKLINRYVLENDELRHLFVSTDIVHTSIKGIIEDGVLDSPDGLDILDRWDLREWLAKHGAAEVTVWSGALQGVYDLVFGYENGDPEKPRLAAGTALRGVLRMAFRYRGAFFYKMTAGMGDIVFSPMYLALKNRGVKFEFFHRVENIGVNADKTVDKIKVWKQVNLKHGTYDPFVNVNGIDCWPAEPNYDQIVEGEELKAKQINLESYWTDWAGGEIKTLELGTDFDKVVLGISIGAFPFVAQEMSDADDSWRTMVENIGTVRTMSMQLWLNPDLNELGWENESPMLDGYAQPHNTWADMTHLLPNESWGGDKNPKSIAYYCGPMVGENVKVVNPTDSFDEVRRIGKEWLEQHMGFLWPKAAPAGNSRGFDFAHLTANPEDDPEQRYLFQYFRANVDPSERYVLSLPGTTQYRKRPGESGFRNVVLAGDWTQNDLNAGCVEATVMSGMLASQALCGTPTDDQIIGKNYA